MVLMGGKVATALPDRPGEDAVVNLFEDGRGGCLSPPLARMHVDPQVKGR